ncbi:MAG: hypothetical protein SWN10_23610, partial [Pseudomonadota bacterium]|nr:hypothetical protein [Pseudomonadota bacterium]
FDWTTPTAPVADITFGPVQRDGDLAPKTAALLASEINARLEVDGYNHAGAFAIDPAIDPAVDPVGFQAELTAANLRGFVDTSIESTVFVRRDGNTIMTGPLINENDNWSLIGRDADGNENDAPQDPIASANLNDVFVRSAGDNGMWASETHELAEEAYRLAVRAPLFVTNIRSGDGVAKPDCPNPMIPKVYAEPAGFIGGPDLSDTRLVSGVRTRINDLGANWQIFMDILYEGQSSFQTVPSDEMGLIRVTVKCSPP